MEKRLELENFEWLNREDHPVKTAENEAAVMENYLYRVAGKKGTLIKRNGIQRKNANQLDSVSKPIMNMYEAAFKAGSKLLLNNDNDSSSKLFEVSSAYTGTFTALSGGDAAWQSRLQYAMLRDNVFVVNRNDGAFRYPNAVYNGGGSSAGVFSAGVIPCDNTVITLLDSAGGNLVPGQYYQYVVTFTFSNGEESTAIVYFDRTSATQSPYLQVGVGNGTITLSNIPVCGDSRCTGRKIYRSAGFLGTTNCTEMFLLAVIQNNAETTFADSKADTELGDAVDLFALTQGEKPYMAQNAAVHKQRLFLGSIEDDLYSALTTDVISIADSATAGSLTAGKKYTWVFYKTWIDNAKGRPTIRYSLPLAIEHTMGAGKTSVDITYSGSDNWYKTIGIQRSSEYSTTSPGDYKFITLQNIYGTKVALIAAGFNDGFSDAARVSPESPAEIIQVSSLQYKSAIAYSETGMPNKFPRGNFIPVDTDNGDEITNLFQKDDEVYIFKNKGIYSLNTRAGGPEFWRVRQVVGTVGADPFGACKTDTGFVFVNTSLIGSPRMNIYEWNESGAPVQIDEPIRAYLNDIQIVGGGTINLKDIKYDERNKWVWIILTYTSDSADYTKLLIYDTVNRDRRNRGLWYIWHNDTYNLNLNCLCDTKNYGMLIGSNIGYIMFYDETSNQDNPAGTQRSYTSRWRTKTFYVPGANVRPSRFIVDIETPSTAGSSKVIALKYKCDDIAEQSKDLDYTSGQTWHHMWNRNFSGGNINQVRRGNIYFGLEDSNDFQHMIIGVVIDLKVEGMGGRGI